MESLSLKIVMPYVPSAISLVVTLLVMVGTYFGIRRSWDRSVGRDVVNGIAQILLALAGLVVFVILLPVSQGTRENILQFGGLVLTGVVAFSSTTVIRDAAAGVTLRLISPFGRGDYLSTDDLFGRITEIGIFYTEIQTEDRSLVTIMNTNLLSTNFETIPSSGTLLEARVSIGYDVHHENVELALKEAAEEYELEDPFVHVEDLGNYAVTYRVAGLLTDLENLLAARSDFRKKVLDKMHEHEIEIVSPDFLNRRDVNEKQFIPQKRTSDKKKVEKDEEAERTTEVVFEKALEAQEVEELEELLDRMEEQLANRKESGRTTERIQSKIEQVKQKKEQLEEELGDEE